MSLYRRLPTVLVLTALAWGLAGCSTFNNPFSSPSSPEPPPAAPVPSLPPAFPPQDIVGRWGLAAYHKEEDRARIETAAADQCKQPYVITLGPDRRRHDAPCRRGDASRNCASKARPATRPTSDRRATRRRRAGP